MTAPRALALSLVPLAFLIGACGARLWLARAPAKIAVDLAQPYAVVTSWGAYGAGAFAIFAATVVVAAVGTIVAARAFARDAVAVDVRAIVSVSAISIACAWLWPFAFSSDVYAYAAYGAMVRDGLDPYVLLPAHVHGAFYDAARWQWGGAYPVCVYGPAFVALASGLVTAFGSLGVATTLTAFRFATAAAFVGSIALLSAALATRPPRERTIALCAYALNPTIVWAVAEGHNDAWLLLAVTASAALVCSRPRLGAFVLGASVVAKAPGAAFAVAALFDGRLRRHRNETALAAVRPFVAAGLALGIVVCLAVMLPAFTAVGIHGTYAPAVSVQGLVGPIPAVLIAFAAAGYGCRLLLASSRTGYAWLGIALLVGLPNGYPWYAVWLVPFALAAGPGRASFALWAATLSSVLRYLPDATGDMTPGIAHLAAGITTLPLLYALTGLRSSRQATHVNTLP